MPSFTPADHQIIRNELENRKLDLYRPYVKQQVFHKNGSKYRERLLRAGNQVGKTMSAAAETAYHATGEYPDWWEGRRFDMAPVIWCAGVTGEVVRDSIQRLLVGGVGQPGTGFIPESAIEERIPGRGVADLLDTILVKHKSGNITNIRLKYYEQGREKFQAGTVQAVWLDEEPDMDIYLESLTRTNATGGMLYMTFTPLKGMSEVVRRFLMEKSPDRSDTNMTIDDALHIPEAERQRIIDSYPEHEREARIKGTPILGSGRIFPISESEISCEPHKPHQVRPFWMQIGGLDFGWDHPTAAVKLLYDPQGDIIYVTQVYKRRQASPLIHAAALRSWGKNFMWAWPHDGLQHDKGSGVQLAELYKQEGMNLTNEHATFGDDRGNGVEAGIAEMLMRMETGRWKVYSHLEEWFEEFRLYHRREGKVVKELDDLISASRYAMMMIRMARPIEDLKGMYGGNKVQSNYNPLDINYIEKDYANKRSGSDLSSYDPLSTDYLDRQFR